MSQAGFEVRPVRRYAAPRYPTRDHAAPEPEAAPDPRLTLRAALRSLVCALLLLGLVLGAIACGDRGRLAVVPPRHDGGVTPDGGGGPDGGLPPDGGDDGGDILLGDVATCTPADVYCVDSATLMACADDVLQPVACDGYCQETFGPQSYSAGCDVAQPDPCQCYDMLDGGMALCTPDMIECVDASTVTTCDPASGSLVTSDCDAYCAATVGPGAIGTGCDATRRDDPCGCVRPARR